MSKKCLLFARTSTTKQEIDSQVKDVKIFAESLGFDEFEYLEKKGASAYKVAYEYKDMIDDMKSIIERNKDIRTVVVWSLNRLFRNERMGIELKEWFIENKIQLYVKEPFIKLLNDDGTVNTATELTFAIFSIFAKQEVDELRAKIKRAKKRDMAVRKYLGGPVVSFGYFVDTDKYVKPHPTDSKIIQDIFNLYATGEYSYATLMTEINERYATNFSSHYMYTVLHNKRYYDGVMYEPIITEEQYRKAEEKRDVNNFKPMESKRHTFANRIIKCPVCGRGLTGNVRDYRCTNACGKSMSISNLDGLLWTIASHLEGEWLLNVSTKEDYVQKQAVLASKIKSAEQSLTKGEKKAERGKKMALEGLIEVEEYKDILKEVELEQKETRKKIEHWQLEISEIDNLIKEDGKDIQRILRLSDTISAMDEQQMYNIVRRWIKRIDFEDNIFTIKTLTRTYKARYDRYDRKYNRWFTLNNNPIATRQLYRDKDGCSLGDVRISPVDLPITLAWLSGSEVV